MIKTKQAQATPTWRAFINWHADAVLLDEVVHDTHPYLDSKGWFAVLAATIADETHIAAHDAIDLLYIGDAFTGPLRDQVAIKGPLQGRLQAACPADKTLIVILGKATNRSRKKRSADYLDGVLRALRVGNECKVVDDRESGPFVGEFVSVISEGDFHPLEEIVLLQPDKRAAAIRVKTAKTAQLDDSARRAENAKPAETTPPVVVAVPAEPAEKDAEIAKKDPEPAKKPAAPSTLSARLRNLIAPAGSSSAAERS